MLVTFLIAMTTYETKVAKGKRGLFGPRLEGAVHHGEDGMAARPEAAGHAAFPVPTQRAMNADAEPVFTLASVQDPSPFHVGFPTSINPV